MNTVGPSIGQLRQKHGLTQEQLTARCGVLGWRLSRGTVAKIESQVRCVSDAEIYILALALKCEIKDLYPKDKQLIVDLLNQGDA